MSSGHPFNSLGQLLSEGFEKVLGLAKAHDYSPGRILALIGRYGRGASQEDIDYVDQLSTDMVTAAEIMNGLDPDTPIPIDGIPVNPYLFGDEPAGRRLWFSTDFSSDEGETWYRLDMALPDDATVREIFDAVNDEALQRMKQSPGAFNQQPDQPLPELMIRIMAAERRF